MTPKLLGGPFLIQIYNFEPLLAWAIKTAKVNTVPSCMFQYHLLGIFFWKVSLRLELVKVFFIRFGLLLIRFSYHNLKASACKISPLTLELALLFDSKMSYFKIYWKFFDVNLWNAKKFQIKVHPLICVCLL